jgi:hypothetical protein
VIHELPVAAALDFGEAGNIPNSQGGGCEIEKARESLPGPLKSVEETDD